MRKTEAAAELESQQQLTANVNRFMALLVVIALGLTMLEPKNELLTSLGFYGPTFIVFGINEVFIRRGYFRLAGWVLSLTLFTTVASATWLFGGLRNEMGATYVLVVIMAAGTLGGRAALALGILSAVSVTGVAWAQARGALPEPLAPPSVFNSWMSVCVSIVVSSLLARATLRGMKQSWIAASQASQNQEMAERKYILAQRLEPMGRLASGLAHDFNNMLGVVTYCSSALREDADEESAEILDILDSATSRAELMTNQLLYLNRKRSLAPAPLELGKWLRELAPMLSRLMGDDVEVELRTEETETWVMADRGQFEQVLLNLAVNARQAMPRGGRLSLGIRVDRQQAVLEVSDTGEGMDEATTQNIFTPFFSTKSTGTGLGLSTVKDIVHRHDAQIEVQSQRGQGTTFVIRVALTEAPAFRPVSGKAAISKHVPLKVVVAEDNGQLRCGLVRILQGLGHEVWALSNGEQVLSLVGGGFLPDLVLSDLSMPKMGGEELFRRMEKTAPSVHFILTSGGAAEVPEPVARSPRLIDFLKKPVIREQLKQALAMVSERQTLEAKAN